jgi:hypothetical protein
MLLSKNIMLREMHDDLLKIAEEIDDEEIVPERYKSNLAAYLSEHDSRMLKEAASTLHRLSLNAQYKDTEPKSNYVNFNKEARNG